jgi:hypothetical protein
MRSLGIVVTPPAFDQHLGFVERDEDLGVEKAESDMSIKRRTFKNAVSSMSKIGYFDPVSVENSEKPFDEDYPAPSMLLWRGHEMYNCFKELENLNKNAL